MAQQKLFDPLAVWDTLTPEQQRQLGAAAIVVGLVAVPGSELRDEAWSWEAAFHIGTSILQDTVEAPKMPAGVPDLNGLGVRMCRGCGCTDLIGCECGCSWVAQTRCSHCWQSLLNN